MKITETINNILTIIPETRNNDTLLCFKVWETEGLEFNILELQATDGTLTSPETITRHRRHIQNTEGRLLPTNPSVMILRKIAERHIREYYSNQPGIINNWEQFKYGIR